MYFNCVCIVVVSVVLLQETRGKAISANITIMPGIRLGLTVSSLITTEPPRQLELSWWSTDVQPGDIIALLNVDPSSDFTALTPLASQNVTGSKGYFRTNIKAPFFRTEELGFTSRCLGYWVAYVRDGTVLASKCLKTYPTWMDDNREEIKTMKLRQMFLPGTHDSAAYKINNGEERETFVTKYSITQEEDVLSQLIHGARYLDLRVGHYKMNSEVWWANHGVVRIHPLRDILDQIKTFMRNTNEIVILDIQEFDPGFGKDMGIHMKLVQFLVAELSAYMTLPSLTWEARMVDVWQSGRRLIVTYDNESVVAASTLLWSAVEHRWGNVQSLDSLHEYLEGVVTRPHSHRPWAAMAELTPTTWSFVTNKLGSLRDMANLVNRNVTDWFRGPWGGLVNVVAVDFLKGTEIVEDAIEWNRRRARQITSSINS